MYSFKSFPLIRALCVMIFAGILSQGYAQPGMEPDPKENENIKTTISFYNANNVPELTENFNNSDWYYIAFTKPIAGNGALYVDGDFVGDIDWESIAYDHTILNIGVTFRSIYQAYFSGTIDEIRVTNTIKDATAIKNYYFSNQPFSSEAATAYIWRFDEGAGDKFYDEDALTSGTLYGAPSWVDGKFGKAIKYDGIDDRGRLNVDLVEYQVTYECWVKFDGEVRTESQTIIQPYGSSTSIDMQIQQTLIEPEPPVREDVVFNMPDLQTIPGETVIVPVTVEKFIDILTVQQTIAWDPSLFQFVAVQDFNLDDLDISSFNLYDAGKLTMSWTPADLQTVTLEDETVIFSVLLQAIGAGGASSNIAFTDDPTIREVSDGETNVLRVVYKDGSLSIQDEVELTGFIRTQSGNPIADFEVQLSGGMDQTTRTDEFGNYIFNVSPGQEYIITPVFDGQYSADDGVSTLDLIIMQWYILGTKNLMSSYDLIASDVNQSGSLTTVDVAQTRAVILHTNESFTGRNAVEFISYEYIGTPDVFNYENSITTTPTGSESGLDFTAVKLGDAGRNWVVNQSGGRYDNLDIFQMIVQQRLENDKQVKVSLKSKDFDNILGLQFTLEWDPLVYELKNLKDSKLEFNSFSGFKDQGKMTFVWNTEFEDGITLDDDQILSELEFYKIKNNEGSSIRISSSITPALAFNSNLEALRILALDEAQEFDKLKIYPNPAQEVIFIDSFGGIMSKYSIMTMTGSVVKTGVLDNARQIEIQELGRGVYVLQLTDGNALRTNHKFIKE